MNYIAENNYFAMISALQVRRSRGAEPNMEKLCTENNIWDT